MEKIPVLFLCSTAVPPSATLLAAPPPQDTERTQVLRAWLYDEKYATSHAREGIYTATRADCTKDGIAKGIKILLIDPKGKRILALANPDAGKDYLGDFVEIYGAIGSEAKSSRIRQLKIPRKSSNKHAAPSTHQRSS